MFRPSKVIAFAAMFGFVASVSAVNVPISQSPPGGLTRSQVPQFIVLGSDDNTSGTGLKWIVDFISGKTNPGTAGGANFEGRQIDMSFYMIGTALNDDSVVTQLQRAIGLGCEVGNHTMNHSSAVAMNIAGTAVDTEYTQAQRAAEISACSALLASKLGITSPAGFRQPYVQWSPETFAAVAAAGFKYDCSLSGGHEYWYTTTKYDSCGTYEWPYTLDGGAPIPTTYSASGDGDYWAGILGKSLTQSFPGLWELPDYMFTGPQTDAECAQYGVPAGFIQRTDLRSVPAGKTYSNGGKITGLDYNMYATPEILDSADALATLESTFDKMYNGNRTPFDLGMHSQFYTSYPEDTVFTNIKSVTARRWVIESFINYALQNHPDVRFVTGAQLVAWLESPKALGTTGGTPTFTLNVAAANGTVGRSLTQATYDSGTVVTLTATANSGYHFTGWSGAITGTTNPTTITMDGNKAVTAIFTADVVTSTDSVDMFNTNGYWFGDADPTSTIDSAFAETAPLVAPYTIAKASSADAYDTYAELVAHLPVVMTGAKSIKITYMSDKPINLQLVQTDFVDSSNYYFHALPIQTSWSTVTLNVDTSTFKQPTDFGTAGPLNLANIEELSLAPNVDVTAAPAPGTIQINEFKVYGIKEPLSGIIRSAGALKDLSVSQIGRNVVLNIRKSGDYAVSLYAVDGRHVATLASGHQNVGVLSLSTTRFASGMYVLRLTGPAVNLSSKIIIN